jgi:hypothetical protein
MMMKKIMFLILAGLMGIVPAFGQSGTGQGKLLKRDTIQTRTPDRKQLRKRDSTGIYHEQNIKDRTKRQSQASGSSINRGQGRKQKGTK